MGAAHCPCSPPSEKKQKQKTGKAGEIQDPWPFRAAAPCPQTRSLGAACSQSAVGPGLESGPAPWVGAGSSRPPVAGAWGHPVGGLGMDCRGISGSERNRGACGAILGLWVRSAESLPGPARGRRRGPAPQGHRSPAPPRRSAVAEATGAAEGAGARGPPPGSGGGGPRPGARGGASGRGRGARGRGAQRSGEERGLGRAHRPARRGRPRRRSIWPAAAGRCRRGARAGRACRGTQ